MSDKKLCECGCGAAAPIATFTDKKSGAIKGMPQRFIRFHASKLRGRTPDGRKVCPRCKEPKPETIKYFRRSKSTKSGLAAVCKLCMDKASKEYDIKKPEKKRFRNTLSMRRRRAKNPEYFRERDRKRSAKLKKEMVDAYGGKCSCCGESEIRFLTIEHTNKDGAEHRKKVGGGSGTWMDLKKRGWPKEGFTILCWNCNCSQKDGLPCPHELSRTAVARDLT